MILWGRLLTCSGLSTRLPTFVPTPPSAIGNRAQDSILPHNFSPSSLDSQQIDTPTHARSAGGAAAQDRPPDIAADGR